VFFQGWYFRRGEEFIKREFIEVERERKTEGKLWLKETKKQRK